MGHPGYITVRILFVLAAIGYVYYTRVFLAIPAWLGLSTVAGLANATVFTVFVVACVATYAIAVSCLTSRTPGAPSTRSSAGTLLADHASLRLVHGPHQITSRSVAPLPLSLVCSARPKKLPSPFSASKNHMDGLNIAVRCQRTTPHPS